MAPEVTLENITVRFGALTALDNVSLTLVPGERHAVVGENGAGKSTLMKVLFGALYPNEGRVLLDGFETRFTTPRDAIAAGVGMVHQHFDLVSPFTVWENVVLGAEPRTPFGALDSGSARERVARLADESRLDIDPDARVETLSVAAQQRTEILKALWRDAKVLILDEPTAVLAPAEARELWAITERLASAGRSLIFITHKLDEVMAHADRVTVLRRGKSILNGVPKSETSPEMLALAMVGEATAEPIATGRTTAPAARPLLQLQRLSAGPRLNGVSLEVFPGEILGLAGVDGSGQTELIAALAGLIEAQGKALISGTDLLALTIRQRRALGLGFLPDDRLRLALTPGATLTETAVLGRQRDTEFQGKFGLLKRKAMERFTTECIERFDVRGGSPFTPVHSLSGGNQQKLVLARELSRKPSLLLAAQPTRGLDFTATAFVHQALRVERDRGAAIMVSSLDLSELLALCDRIAVLLSGKLVGIVHRADANEEKLGQLMTGAMA